MSISITFNGETPEDIQREIARAPACRCRLSREEADALAAKARILRAKGLTQRAIANALGISRETVCYYLTRYKAPPARLT